MTLATADIWTPTEREAWKYPKQMKPSEWAEQYRTLYDSNYPGRWRGELAPYLRGMMDLPLAAGVDQVNIMKSAQVGFSEAQRNVIGYLADQEPDPVGLVLPDREKGEKIVQLRIHPLFTDNPQLSRHLPLKSKRALKKTRCVLTDGFVLHLMWAGSDSSTSADPLRFVFNDEVDKFREWGGREPDPVNKTRSRLMSYEGRACQINGSTPSQAIGKIATLFAGSTYKLYFMVPCPRCGVVQRLVFTQLKWKKPRGKTSEEQEAEVFKSGPWYECVECGKSIKESQKPEMIRAGRWGTLDGEIGDAEAVKEWPAGTRLGMQISGLYPLWTSWASIAAAFITRGGTHLSSYNFHTEKLGEPWEEQQMRIPENIYEQRVRDATHPERVVPDWAYHIGVTVDTQHTHFYVNVRAHGAGRRSQLLYNRVVETFQDIDAICAMRFPNEDPALPSLVPKMGLIDSGGTKLAGEEHSRTLDVYRYVLQRRPFFRAIKGAPHKRSNKYFWKSLIETAVGKLDLWLVDTGHYKDVLATDVIRGAGDSEESAEQEMIWFLNSNVDKEYCKQMANQRRVIDAKKGRVKWIPYSQGSRYDWHDTEAYQCVLSDMLGIHLYPDDLRLKPIDPSPGSNVPAGARRGKRGRKRGFSEF